jgi:predicted secreted protein
MKLKKANAAVGLLSALFMLVHIGYNVFCYLAFYYDPMLLTAVSLPFIVLACVHAVLGMLTLFLSSDGTCLDDYPRQNRRIILKRVSAALIFPLLIVHINSFGVMQKNAQAGNALLVVLLIVCEVLFFAVVLMHVATSLTAGFITLGLVESREVQVRMDRAVYVIGALAFVLSSCSVVSGHAKMFLLG